MNTFTRWCNDYLKVRGIFIQDVKNDFKDGLALINLMEVISGKKIEKYNRHPRINIQKLENIQIALKFIQDEGIKLVNIGAEDINMGNIRLILGLIWTLILRYEIKSGSDNNSAMEDLLKWVRSKIPEYDIKNFTTDWNDGRAVCGLVNALRPGLIPDHRAMDPNDRLNNATKGIDLAESKMGVDKLIFPAEMTHPKVDKLAMMTYIAQFRNLPEIHNDAARCQAYGPGLVEGVIGQPAKFTVLVPKDIHYPLVVKVTGANGDEAKCDTVKKGDTTFACEYVPSNPGVYNVSITVNAENIPGSAFRVPILASESLGGEGKIRVFYSTTSASEKYKKDKIALENLLRAKKVHLREDFEPWIPVDVMDSSDREAVFRKAGTRVLPIVFVDDKYAGDYDKLLALNENEQLDALLHIDQAKLISEEMHMMRLKAIPSDARERSAQ